MDPNGLIRPLPNRQGMFEVQFGDYRLEVTIGADDETAKQWLKQVKMGDLQSSGEEKIGFSSFSRTPAVVHQYPTIALISVCCDNTVSSLREFMKTHKEEIVGFGIRKTMERIEKAAVVTFTEMNDAHSLAAPACGNAALRATRLEDLAAVVLPHMEIPRKPDHLVGDGWVGVANDLTEVKFAAIDSFVSKCIAEALPARK